MRYSGTAMNPQIVTILGLIAGSLTTLSFLPQAVAVYQRKSAEDLSYGYLFTFATGVVLWLAYGLYIQQWPVILANAVTLMLVVLIIVLKFHYRRTRPKAHGMSQN